MQSHGQLMSDLGHPAVMDLDPENNIAAPGDDQVPFGASPGSDAEAHDEAPLAPSPVPLEPPPRKQRRHSKKAAPQAPRPEEATHADSASPADGPTVCLDICNLGCSDVIWMSSECTILIFAVSDALISSDAIKSLMHTQRTIFGKVEPKGKGQGAPAWRSRKRRQRLLPPAWRSRKRRQRLHPLPHSSQPLPHQKGKGKGKENEEGKALGRGNRRGSLRRRLPLGPRARMRRPTLLQHPAESGITQAPHLSRGPRKSPSKPCGIASSPGNSIRSSTSFQWRSRMPGTRPDKAHPHHVSYQGVVLLCW